MCVRGGSSSPSRAHTHSSGRGSQWVKISSTSTHHYVERRNVICFVEFLCVCLIGAKRIRRKKGEKKEQRREDWFSLLLCSFLCHRQTEIEYVFFRQRWTHDQEKKQHQREERRSGCREQSSLATQVPEIPLSYSSSPSPKEK